MSHHALRMVHVDVRSYALRLNFASFLNFIEKPIVNIVVTREQIAFLFLVGCLLLKQGLVDVVLLAEAVALLIDHVCRINF